MPLTFQGPGPVPIRLRVNGEEVALYVEPRRTLLDVLRAELGLTGAKDWVRPGQLWRLHRPARW